MKIHEYNSYKPLQFYLYTGKVDYNFNDEVFGFALLVQHLRCDNRNWDECIIIKQSHIQLLDGVVNNIDVSKMTYQWKQMNREIAHQYKLFGEFGPTYTVESFELCDVMESLDNIAIDMVNDRSTTIKAINDKNPNPHKRVTFDFIISEIVRDNTK